MFVKKKMLIDIGADDYGTSTLYSKQIEQILNSKKAEQFSKVLSFCIQRK